MVAIDRQERNAARWIEEQGLADTELHIRITSGDDNEFETLAQSTLFKLHNLLA